jgi:hypothetical protein
VAPHEGPDHSRGSVALGVVNELAEGVMEAAIALAETIASMAPEAVQATKRIATGATRDGARPTEDWGWLLTRRGRDQLRQCRRRGRGRGLRGGVICWQVFMTWSVLAERWTSTIQRAWRLFSRESTWSLSQRHIASEVSISGKGLLTIAGRVRKAMTLTTAPLARSARARET